MVAAGFITEVSAAIRFRTWVCGESELGVQLAAVAETIFEAKGGLNYLSLRSAAMTLADRKLGCECDTLNSRQDTTSIERELESFRAEHAVKVREAQHALVRSFWANFRQRPLPEDPFTHLDSDHPLPVIARYNPIWWELFTRRLFTEFARRDLTQYHLLDELSTLRQHTHPKMVLAARVEEWRAAHADELGLPARLHYHVIARRGLQRARAATAWFNARSPGYARDASVVAAAHESLWKAVRQFTPSAPSDWSVN